MESTTHSDCLFCQMVAGQVPIHEVYQDEKFLAFLSIFPNTDGVTVVIPKNHLPSYVFANSDDDIAALMSASKKVARQIELAYPDVGRVGVVFEGFGVDHLHAKLFPLHDTAATKETWRQIESERAAQKPTAFFARYEGYISSHDGAREDDKKLAKIAKKISSVRE